MANPSINWGMINDGSTFESLMQSLVYANDPQAKLFGKPGKDQGMDARSGDGTTIYQAKFIGSRQYEEAINLAKSEYEKIKAYREPTNSNYETWRSVDTWVLFTNVLTNNNWQEKWNSEIIPLFGQLGIYADLRSSEILEQELALHSEIREAYFGSENRTLYYPREAYNYLIESIPGITFYKMPFTGRDAEIGQIDEFLKGSKRVLFVTGAHGVGKTRFLYEAFLYSAKNYRVFWGQASAMDKSSNWFQGVTRPVPTVLFVDDCDNKDLLDRILGLLHNNEHANWKLVLVYSAEKSSTLQEVFLPFDNNQTITLKGASVDSCEYVCHGVFPQCTDIVVNRIAEYTKGNFAFISFLLSCIERYGKDFIDEGVLTLASVYVKKSLSVLTDNEQSEALSILRRLSLLGTVTLTNDPNDPIREFLRGDATSTSDRLLKAMRSAGIVKYMRHYGDRYRIVSPLLQQLILSEWLLSKEDNQKYTPNSEGKSLIEALISGKFKGLTDSILSTLSRLAAAYLPEAEGESFLAPLFEGIREIVACCTASNLSSCIELLKKIGCNAPERAMDIVKVVVDRSDIVDETITNSLYGDMTFSRSYVLSGIPQLVYDLALCVRRTDIVLIKKVLVTFEKLSKLEANGVFKLYGTDCKTFIQRLLTQPCKKDVFSPVAYEIVRDRIEEIDKSPFIETMAKALLTVVRSSTEMAGRSICFYYELVPMDDDCQSWKIISGFWDFLWDKLKITTDGKLRVAIWRLISCGAASFYGAELQLSRGADEKTVDAYKEKALGVLIEIHKRLESGGCSNSEILAMRDIWRRHLPYTDLDSELESEMASLAKECEAIYVRGDDIQALARRYYRNWMSISSQRQAIVSETAARICDFTSADQLRQFFDIANEILPAKGDKSSYADYGLTWELSRKLSETYAFNVSSPVTEFVKSSISAYPNDNALINIFVYVFIDRCLKATKDNGARDVVSLLEEVLSLSHNNAELMRDVYANASPNMTGTLTGEEFDILRERLPTWDFKTVRDIAPKFVGVCREKVLHLLSEAFNANPNEAENLLWAIVNEWYMLLVRDSLGVENVPVDWLIEQISVRPEIPVAIFNDYNFEALFEKTGKKANADTLNKILASGRKFEYGVKLTKFFYKDSPGAFSRICAWIVGDSDAGKIPSFFSLPNYLAALDPDASDSRSYIDSNGAVDGLRDADLARRLKALSRLAGGYANNTEAWELIAEPILVKAESLSKDARIGVYHALGPLIRSYSSWGGEIPREITARYENAKAKFEEIKDNHLSVFYSYREWELKEARAEYERAVDVAKAEKEDYEL